MWERESWVCVYVRFCVRAADAVNRFMHRKNSSRLYQYTESCLLLTWSLWHSCDAVASHFVSLSSCCFSLTSRKTNSCSWSSLCSKLFSMPLDLSASPRACPPGLRCLFEEDWDAGNCLSCDLSIYPDYYSLPPHRMCPFRCPLPLLRLGLRAHMFFVTRNFFVLVPLKVCFLM